MTYRPREFWAQEFADKGPAYVGATPETSDAQADAFWREIEPRLTDCHTQTALDYGCGVGRLAPRIATLLGGAEYYTGVDINLPAVEHARRTHPDMDFRLIADGLVPVPTDSIDIVVAVTVLQHVPESLIVATCSEIARVFSYRSYSRVILIEDANPEGYTPAPHMSFRSAERYAELLGMRVVAPPIVFDAERPGSHYIVELA